MLASVPRGMSFFGCGTVTIPGFVGCLKWWCDPFTLASDQPSRLSARMTSAELTRASISYMVSRASGGKAAASRRQPDANADGRGDDVDEARPAFSDPSNIRAVEIPVELVAHRHGSAPFIDAQHGCAQTRNLHNVPDRERRGSNDARGPNREQPD